MSWAEATVGFLLGMLANECLTVSPWLAGWMVRWAARCRYADQVRAQVREEEWAALVAAVPSHLLKLVVAVGFASSAGAARLRRLLVYRRPPRTADAAASQRVDAATEASALYQQPGIVVTRDSFVVAGRRFPVQQLSRLRTARGPRDVFTVRVAVGVGIVAAGLVAVAVAAVRDGHMPLAVGAAMTAALSLVLVMISGRVLRPRAFELWAEFHGLTMLVFTSDSAVQYGQVTRAVLRAREMGCPSSPDDPDWN